MVKNTRNLFRVKKEQNDAAIKGVENYFKLEKELKENKDIPANNCWS